MKRTVVGLIACVLMATPQVRAQVAARRGPSVSHGVAPQEIASRAWTLRHFGPEGLHKCRAFRKVRVHTAELQKADGGSLTPGERRNLEAELKAANALPPASATPVKCGVPL